MHDNFKIQTAVHTPEHCSLSLHCHCHWHWHCLLKSITKVNKKSTEVHQTQEEKREETDLPSDSSGDILRLGVALIQLKFVG